MSAREWIIDALADPNGGASSTRLAAMLCTVAGIGIAIAGMVWNREQSATVIALLGGGAGAFFARTKSCPPAGAPSE